MNGLKIMCLKMEHFVFLYGISFLPCPLRKLLQSYRVTVSKSWNSHYFETEVNLDYIGPIPEVTYYGAKEMGEEERREFLAWYDSHKTHLFANSRVLEKNFQDNFTVLREACRVFRREFMKIGNIDVFIESIKIPSGCINLLRKRFLQPDTIGLIPTGGYICNNNYSKKALMWLLHME